MAERLHAHLLVGDRADRPGSCCGAAAAARASRSRSRTTKRPAPAKRRPSSCTSNAPRWAPLRRRPRPRPAGGSAALGLDVLIARGKLRIRPDGTRTYVRVIAEATILHADLDSFFASVEQRDDPRLLGRPVIVGAGVVLAASYEAKAFGVKTAMGGRRARRAVPAGDRRAAALRGLLGGQQGRVRGLRRHVAGGRGAVDRRGVPRRARDAADRGRAGRDRRAAAGAGARRGRAADHGRRRADEVPGQGGVARVAKPDGLLVVEPARGARVPAPAAGRARCGASAGQDRGQAARPRDHRPWGRWPRSRSWRSSGMLGKASGRHLHALAHNRDPRPVVVGAPATIDRRPARDRPARAAEGARVRSTRSWSG